MRIKFAVLFLISLLPGCQTYQLWTAHHTVELVHPGDTQIRLQPGFDAIEVKGPVDVEIFASRQRYEVQVMGKDKSLKGVSTQVKDNTLLVEADPAKVKSPTLVTIITSDVHTIKYKGDGIVKAVGLNSPILDLTIDTDKSTYFSGNEMGLTHLNLDGSGTVILNGIKSQNLSIKARGDNKIYLSGEAQLRNVYYTGRSHINMYWVDSPYLNIRGRGEGSLTLAGTVDILDGVLDDQAYFNGKYLRVNRSYMKTFDRSQADIQTAKVQNAFASNSSHIFYFKKPNIKNHYIMFSGNVLDLNGMR